MPSFKQPERIDTLKLTLLNTDSSLSMQQNLWLIERNIVTKISLSRKHFK